MIEKRKNTILAGRISDRIHNFEFLTLLLYAVYYKMVFLYYLLTLFNGIVYYSTWITHYMILFFVEQIWRIIGSILLLTWSSGQLNAQQLFQIRSSIAAEKLPVFRTNYLCVKSPNFTVENSRTPFAHAYTVCHNRKREKKGLLSAALERAKLITAMNLSTLDARWSQLIA